MKTTILKIATICMSAFLCFILIYALILENQQTQLLENEFEKLEKEAMPLEIEINKLTKQISELDNKEKEEIRLYPYVHLCFKDVTEQSLVLTTDLMEKYDFIGSLLWDEQKTRLSDKDLYSLSNLGWDVVIKDNSTDNNQFDFENINNIQKKFTKYDFDKPSVFCSDAIYSSESINLLKSGISCIIAPSDFQNEINTYIDNQGMYLMEYALISRVDKIQSLLEYSVQNNYSITIIIPTLVEEYSDPEILSSDEIDLELFTTLLDYLKEKIDNRVLKVDTYKNELDDINDKKEKEKSIKESYEKEKDDINARIEDLKKEVDNIYQR